MKHYQTKSDEIRLFFLLCAIGVAILGVFFLHRGWFRSHLPFDPIGRDHIVGYGQYFSESSLFDTLGLYVLVLTPPISATVISLLRHQKDRQR